MDNHAPQVNLSKENRNPMRDQGQGGAFPLPTRLLQLKPDSPVLTIWEKIEGGKPAPMSKRLFLENGLRLGRDSSLCKMSKGNALCLAIESDREFAETLSLLKPEHAISLGVFEAAIPDIDAGQNWRGEVTTAGRKQATGKGLARTKTDMQFPAGRQGRVLLDMDLEKAPDHIKGHQKPWDVLTGAVPGLAGAARVERPSVASKARHGRTEQDCYGSSGLHVFVRIKDAQDSERMVKVLADRLTLAGLGWVEIGQAGSILMRTMVDPAPRHANSLSFEGAPVLEDPLVQPPGYRKATVHDGVAVDSREAVPDLTGEEKTRLAEIVAQLRREAEPKAAEAKAAYVERRGLEAVTRARSERPDLSDDEAARIKERIATAYQRLDRTGEISADLPLYLDDGRVIAARDLFMLDGFNGVTMADPMEGPGYGRGKAKAYRNADGSIVIHSFAHGQHSVRVMPDGVVLDHWLTQAEQGTSGRVSKAMRVLHDAAQIKMDSDQVASLKARAEAIVQPVRDRVNARPFRGKKITEAPLPEEPDEPQDFKAFCESLGFDPDHLDMMTLAVLKADFTGKEPDWMTEGIARAEAMETAQAAYEATEKQDPNRHRWMLDMPSHWGQRIAAYLHKAMARDMPGAAAMGALLSLSVLSKNQFFASWEYETGLNLFAAVTAETGSGKDALVSFLDELGNLAGAVTASHLTSAAAVHESLLDDAELCLIVDEWAKALLAQKADRTGNSISLAGTLLALHGRALGSLPARKYAKGTDTKEAVYFPFVTTFGATTGAALNGVLDLSMVSDGTLNRSLLVDAETACGGRWPVGRQLPDRRELIDAIDRTFCLQPFIEAETDSKRVFVIRDRRGGNRNDTTAAKIAVTIDRKHWHRLREELESLETELAQLKELAARFERNAVVVATLLRIGDYTADTDEFGYMQVTDAQMEWAIRFVRQCITELAARFDSRIGESETDKNLLDLRQKVIAALQGKRDKKVARSGWMLDAKLMPDGVLSYLMRGIDDKHRAGLVKIMLVQDWLEELTEDESKALFQGKTGRRPKILYRVLPGIY